MIIVEEMLDKDRSFRIRSEGMVPRAAVTTFFITHILYAKMI